MNENEMTHSEFYGNMTKEEVELRLALAMTKVSHRTGNDFSIRRQPVDQADTGIAPGIHETPNGTVVNATDVTIVIPEKVMVNFSINPTQLNQCDIPDPRIVKTPTMSVMRFPDYPGDAMVSPPRGGYKRGKMIIQTGLGRAMSDFAKKSFSKDVVQADGSQNYLKLRNKRR